LGVGEPIDAAALILYLLSDAAKWVTGKKFTIDGGVLLSSAK
jgi:NAD(P)-dependent dehydrogenase (short-subunit alcohol dehydrogenase family)